MSAADDIALLDESEFFDSEYYGKQLEVLNIECSDNLPNII